MSMTILYYSVLRPSYHLECSKITGSLQTQGLPALTVYCHLFLYYFKTLFYTFSLLFFSFLPPHRCMLETLFSLSWIPQKQHVIAQRLKAGMRMNAGATALRSYWLQWESQQDKNILVRLNNPTEKFETCPPPQGCFQFWLMCLALKEKEKYQVITQLGTTSVLGLGNAKDGDHWTPCLRSTETTSSAEKVWREHRFLQKERHN